MNEFEISFSEKMCVRLFTLCDAGKRLQRKSTTNTNCLVERADALESGARFFVQLNQRQITRDKAK